MYRSVKSAFATVPVCRKRKGKAFLDDFNPTGRTAQPSARTLQVLGRRDFEDVESFLRQSHHLISRFPRLLCLPHVAPLNLQIV